MGFALAEAAALRGAQVHLISGPTPLDAQHPNIKIHRVQSAEEMYTVVHQYYADVDYAIAAAAVADFKPSDKKIKKSKKIREDWIRFHLIQPQTFWPPWKRKSSKC